VLVESRNAQWRAAGLAAGAYLEEICCILDGARLVRDEHVAVFAEACDPPHPSGLSFAVVYFFLASLPAPLRPPPQTTFRTAEVVRAFRGLGLRYGELTGVSERRLGPLADEIGDRGGGLAGLKAALGHDTVKGLILFGGRVGAGELARSLDPEADAAKLGELARAPDDAVGRLFQEFYLGDRLFEETYGFPPSRSRGGGTIFDEEPLVSPESLKRLAEVADLAVATRRSTREAAVALELLGASGLVGEVTSSFDVEACRFDAWSPWPIRAAMVSLDLAATTTFGLVGSPRDVKDTLDAGAKPIGFAWSHPIRRPLKEAGAEAVISRLETLAKVVERVAG
jgi:phosphoglycolate phosphatase-like HAD superfamily hydrolase